MLSAGAILDSGWGRCEGARGGITMALRLIMSARVVRFAGLLPGWAPRGAD